MTAYVHFDNYLVRVLGGTEVLQLPPKGVNATHAKKALDVLSLFDTAVRLEDVGKPSVQDIFRQAFGWRNFTLLGAGQRDNGNAHDVSFSAADREQLRDLNKYDYMLYESIQAL